MTRFSTLLIAFAAVIVGCVSYELEWTKRSGFGPTIGPSAKAPMFQRCEQKLMDGARRSRFRGRARSEDRHLQGTSSGGGFLPSELAGIQNLAEVKWRARPDKDSIQAASVDDFTGNRSSGA
jgi:hypothetical protein